MSVLPAAWIAVGGALGSLARYGLTLAAPEPGGLPMATFLANTIGSFLIGFLFGLSEIVPGLPPGLRHALGTGFLGGFTTFSTFQWETLELMRAGSRLQALAYSLGSVVIGLALAWAGFGAGRYFAALFQLYQGRG